tara:strand:- start:246 stop:953 length:708 start_codon:yes stop_codon:yes gene_type:complete
MVKVDDVYQKVLALANKEQRGYITPQDFNLFASQAQLEIFEQYFYDLNQARKVQGNDTVVADIDDMLEYKTQIFEKSLSLIQNPYALASVGNGKQLPQDLYRLLHVSLNASECELLNTRDFTNVKLLPLTRPTKSRPIANIQAKVITCNDGGADQAPSILIYIKKPAKPNWTYVVVNKKAMYNPNAQTLDFELHASEEIQLVNKILKLSGLAIKQNDVAMAGGTMESLINQQKKI